MRGGLGNVGKQVSSRSIEKALGKTERLNVLVTPQQKQEIRAAAERYGLSMTDYLMRVHALVEAHIRLDHPRKARE